MEDLFFSDGKHLLRVTIATVISYLTLLFIIRIMGQTDISQADCI